MKGIGIIRKLNKALSHYSLITIYKPFVRPHLDYDQPNKESLNQKIERIQFNAALAVTGAIKGTYQSKFYNELGLASLKFRRFLGNCVAFIVYHNTFLILFRKPMIYIFAPQRM